MLTAAWSLLAAIVLLWPGRVLGMFDGAPLSGAAEAIVIGLVVPALWWFDRRFLATWPARAAIVALLVLKVSGLLLTPQGLCARFSTAAPFTGEIATIGINEPLGILRSWDVRADWLADSPVCTAIVDRPYRAATDFPAWWVNLMDFIHPGRPELALDLSGRVRVHEPGTFSLAAADGMAISGTVGQQPVTAAPGGSLSVPLVAGIHNVALHATLTGDQWSLMPMWNGRDAWTSATFTTAPPGTLDRAAGVLGALTSLLVIGFVLGWLTFALSSLQSERLMLLWVVGSAAAFAWLGTEPRLERFAGVALVAALAVPASLQWRNLRGAFLMVGVPWLAFFAAHSFASIGRFTAYSGDDWLAYQVAGYRIFMHGYWLEGGSLAFDYQPLYRWITGSLHLIFGDSSVGETYLDAACLLSGALLAFHLAKTRVGHRAGLAAGVATLATFTVGTIWYFPGRGLSEIVAAGFSFLAAFFLMRARLGRRSSLLAGAAMAVLMFYTRLNHLIFAASLAALLLPLRVWTTPAAVVAALGRLRMRLVFVYGSLVAAGVALFMVRTWWYTGVFSLFYGTSLKNNDTGLRLQTLASADVWTRITHSLATLVWVNEPPQPDVRAVFVVTGVAAALLALLQAPVLKAMPVAIVLVIVGTMASGLFVHTHNYPGRMSITLAPPAAAAAVIAVVLMGRAWLRPRTPVAL